VLKTVKLRQTHNASLNANVLISPKGLTLYHFTFDKAKKIACTGPCLSFWPPLLIKKGAKPTAGPGLNVKKLGTIRRPDGRYQVTYYGFPLYTFASDRRRGDVKGEGVENAWWAVSATGKLVKKPSTA
jgi:predicted lipoprotein with Yx(FWY)xxD motif